MSGVIAVQRATSQLNYLKQYVARFETFHAANFQKEVREFMDFFSQDDVIGPLSRALFGRMTLSTSAWHAEVQSSGALLPLPEGPVECFAFRLGTLRLIRRNKLDLRFFVANHFKGAHLNEMLMHWKRLIVHPFAADCRAFATAAVASLPDAEWVEYEPFIATVLDGPFQAKAFGPRAWTDDDDDHVDTEAVPRPKLAPTPTTVDALDRLESAVKDSGLGQDLLRDVEALRLETQRQVPMRARALARLTSIAKHAELADACGQLEALL